MQKEPGFGRYKDAEPYGSVNGFWEHTEEGWRYFDSPDDQNPGAWNTWGVVQTFAPFTPIDAPEATPDPMAEGHRQVALELAVQTRASADWSAEEIIGTAKVFEAYLKGGE